MNDALHACPACGTANRVGVRFCAQCGANLVSAAPAVAGTPNAPPDSGAGSPPGDGRTLARAAINALGGEVTADTYGDGVDYRYVYRSFTQTLGMPMEFTGELRVTDLRSATAHATARLATKSIAIQVGFVIVGFGIVLALPTSLVPFSTETITNAGAVAMIAMVAICIYAWPRRIREQLLEAVRTAATSIPSTAMPTVAPPAAATPAARLSSTEIAPGSQTAELMAQLQKLLELKNGGLLTEAEFASKKAEILARL